MFKGPLFTVSLGCESGNSDVYPQFVLAGNAEDTFLNNPQTLRYFMCKDSFLGVAQRDQSRKMGGRQQKSKEIIKRV